MNYFIRELSDKRAILVAEDGYELGEFPTVSVAISVCKKDCHTIPMYIERHRGYLESSPADFESSFL